MHSNRGGFNAMPSPQKAKFCLVERLHAYTYPVYTQPLIAPKKFQRNVIWVYLNGDFSITIQAAKSINAFKYPPDTFNGKQGGSSPAKVNSADALVV